MKLPPDGFINLNEFFYSVHISVENKFILFNNPKAGCSTTKATLNTWEALSFKEHLSYINLGQVHDRSYNKLLRPDQLGNLLFQDILKQTEFKKIAFVRRPETRLLSAFLSKLTWDSNELKRYKELCNLKGFKLMSDYPTLSEFVESLNNTSILNSNEHWRPQHKQICEDEIDYTFIGRFESLNQDLMKVQKLIYNDSQMEVIDARQISMQNTTKKNQNIVEELDSLIPMIGDLYKRDYELYYKP
jgi:hypothetical protein